MSLRLRCQVEIWSGERSNRRRRFSKPVRAASMEWWGWANSTRAERASSNCWGFWASATGISKAVGRLWGFLEVVLARV